MRATSGKLILVAIFMVLAISIARAIDTSNAQYTATFTVTNSGAPLAEIAANNPISGQALSNGGFVSANTLNSYVVDGTDLIPSQPSSLQQSIDGAVADDGGVQTTQTTAANNATDNDMTLLPAIPVANDAYYFAGDNRYRILPLSISTSGAGSWTVAWEYWNGSTWFGLSGIDDRTAAFTVGGLHSVSYDLPNDWEITTVNGIADKFWTRARVATFTSITRQPLGRQVWYETGVWWTFIDSIPQNHQSVYSLILSDASSTIENHQFFPGTNGYITPDDAAIELGSGYLLEMTGYFLTNIASGTASYLAKTDALVISNPSSGIVRVDINSGARILDIPSVPSGKHTFRLSDDGAQINFLIAGVGSATATSIAVNDNGNFWRWGLNRTTVYFDNIRITFPIERLDDTTAEWNSGTLVNTEGINNALQLPIQGDTNACTGSSDDIVGWVDNCGASDIIKVVSTPIDTGSRALHLQNISSPITTPVIYQQVVASVGQVWSTSIRCLHTGAISGQSWRIGFYNASQVLIGTETSASSCSLFGSVYETKTINNNTAPALTAFVRVRYIITSSSAGTIFLDSAVLALGAVAPLFGDVSNVLTNPGFESVYNVGSGTRVSPGLTVTSVTNLLDSSIVWIASGTVAGLTTALVEVSLNNESTWLPATNGAFIPGLTVGQNLAAFPAMKTRVTLTTATATMTPYLVSLALSLLDSDDLDLYYAPIEFIGEELDDRSTNDIDAVTSFPNPLNPADVTFTVSPIRSTGVISIQDSESVVPAIVPEYAPGDEHTAGSNIASLPGGTLAITAGNFTDLPPLLFYILPFFLASIAVGGALTAISNSLFAGVAAILAVTMLGVSIGTDGIVPLWVPILIGFSCLGFLAWNHRSGGP